LHSHGLVAGRYQPLADGDTLIPRRPTMPCFLQSRQKAKRNGLDAVSPASLRSRIEAISFVIPSAERNLLYFFVIPSAARNLLLRQKADPSLRSG
jgi:hypothetical protein